MLDVWLVMRKVMLFFALAIPGLLFGKFNKINDDAIDSVTNVLVYIAMPFLVLSKLCEIEPAMLHLKNLLFCLGLPFGLTFIVWLITRAFFPENANNNKFMSSRFCSIFSNCGFLGIPLAIAVFPDEPIISVYISLFNVSSTICMLTFGVSIFKKDKKTGFKEIIFKPVVIAAALGLFVVFFKLNSKVAVVHEYSQYLASLTTPLSMMVLGYEMSKMKFKDLLLNKTVYLVSFIKLVISPILAVIIVMLFGFLPDEKIVIAMFLASAVSTAASAPSHAQNYGADAEFTALLTIGTTVLSIITLPLLSALLEVILIY